MSLVSYGSCLIAVLFSNLQLISEREGELRRLRQEVVRLEEEEKALHSNLDRLRQATGQLEAEAAEQRQVIDKVRSQLDAYRRTLVQAFAHMPFPGKCQLLPSC